MPSIDDIENHTTERPSRSESRRNTIRSLIRSLSPFRINTLTLRAPKLIPKKNKDYLVLENNSSVKSSPASNSRRSFSVPKVHHKPPIVPTVPTTYQNWDAPIHKEISRTRSAPITSSSKGNAFRQLSLSLPPTEEDLTCPICLDLLYRPRQLLCGHLFCVLCLQNCVNSFCGKFVCPSCRTDIDIPPNGVSSLPRNHNLEKVINTFRRQKRKDIIRCAKCLLETQVSICGHCTKQFCVPCGNDHRQEAQDEVNEELEKMRSYLKKTISNIPTMKEEELNRLIKLEEEIKDTVATKIKSLELKGEKLQGKVRELRDERQDRINSLSQDIDLIYDRIKSFKDNNHNWNELGKMYSDFHSLSSAALLKEPAFVLDTKELSLSTVSPQKYRPRRSKSLAGVSSRTQLKPLQRKPSTDEHVAFYRNKVSSCKQTLSQKMCVRPAGIAVSPWNGNIYISGSDSCKIFICDKYGKRISSFGSRGHDDGEFLCPTSMAFSKISNELFITDKWKHCIHAFDCQGNFLRRIGMKGRSHGKFCSPEGICTDNNGNIYVADTCNYRVQVLDNDGVFLRYIGTSANLSIRQNIFMEPSGVAASADGSKVYVADCGSHRIKVFNGHTGECLFIFGSQGENRGEFKSPECIALDQKGFVLVGDSGNGRIQIFSPRGYFIRCLGSRSSDEKGDIGWVSGIAVNSEHEIFVTEFKNSIVSVF